MNVPDATIRGSKGSRHGSASPLRSSCKRQAAHGARESCASSALLVSVSRISGYRSQRGCAFPAGQFTSGFHTERQNELPAVGGFWFLAGLLQKISGRLRYSGQFPSRNIESRSRAERDRQLAFEVRGGDGTSGTVRGGGRRGSFSSRRHFRDLRRPPCGGGGEGTEHALPDRARGESGAFDHRPGLAAGPDDFRGCERRVG